MCGVFLHFGVCSHVWRLAGEHTGLTTGTSKVVGFQLKKGNGVKLNEMVRSDQAK